MKKLILIITILALALSLTGCRPELGVENQPPEPGYYVVSSIGDGENISFLTTIDPANGYVRLEADHTGMMLWGETEQELTWDDEAIYWGDATIPCFYVSDYDEELEMEAAMLLLIFQDTETTAIFRPVEEN